MGEEINIKIVKATSGGEVKAIASKSQAHRMLICAALSDKATFVECSETSDDIEATVGCLRSLGAGITHDGVGFKVEPIKFPVLDELVKQVCGESGATLRFMLPICGALGVPAAFAMVGQLRQRPTSPLLEQLAANGCVISLDKGSIVSSGKLHNGVFNLQGNVSSQFISGLLMALPLLDGESFISVEGKLESRPYVMMTLEALTAFGISVLRRGSRADRGMIYLIEGPQSFRSPGWIGVEGDWSNAAAWLCAGALGGSGVTCTGLNFGSCQGDMAILRYLERFGASVSYEGDRVSVTHAKMRGIEINAADTPDIVPLLALVASVAVGETVITNAGRLRFKESDRLRAVTKTLGALGADITELDEGLVIRGREMLNGGTVDSYGDHRIVMMAAVASVACKNPVTINAAEVVNKSYPDFFRDFELLNGKVQAI